MMTCTKCGRPDTEGSRFCTFCGATLVATQMPATEISPPPTAIGYPPPPVADRLVGQTIDGKYRIDARIGVGGMGTVYRATRLMIGDVVAVKVMHQEQSAPAQAAERFRREAQAAARLKHPNAVTIHDFGVSTGGMLYLVMELVEGESLRNVILRQGPLAPPVAAEILNQIAAALDEAHRHNIVHRDLKPDNIIVRTSPQGLHVKALDFGIAKLRDLRTSDNLTQTGALLGTPQYMSPEQCLGEELDGRSDIYSLGIVLFEMLTGAIPFNAPSAAAIILQQVQQPPPSPRAVNINISPAVEAVVLHALQKQREARPQTAGVLAKEMMFAISNPELGNVAAQSPTAAHGPRMTNPPSLSDASPPLAPTAQMGMPSPAPIPSPRSETTLTGKSNSKLVPLLVATVLALVGIGGITAWLLWSRTAGNQGDALLTAAKQETRIEKPEIEQFLQRWEQDWQRSDLRAFSEHYDESFFGRNYSSQKGYRDLNRAEWLKDKEEKFRRSQGISIAIGPLIVNYSGNDAIVSFQQSYRSSAYNDSGQKTLTLRRKADGKLSIVREDFVPSGRK